MSFAQVIEVKKFEPQNKNQTAVSIRNDINGNPCATLIVQSLKEGLKFEGWVVGDVERKEEQYIVYMAGGSKHIKIKHSDFQTKDIVFGDYGISSLKGGLIYSLLLVDETKDIVNKVYRLGWNLNDMVVPDNVKTFLRMAATRGDKKAQIAMAQLSLEGKVRALDGEVLHKGIRWIKALLAEGDSTCLDQMPGELMYVYSLQLMKESYRSGEISSDRSVSRVDTISERRAYTRICEYEIKACIKGFSQAGDDLFEDYLKSNGLPQYSKAIIRCCLDSANVGNISAMSCLGFIYERGFCEDVDLSLAAEWYKRIYTHNTIPNDLCRVYGNKNYPITDKEMKFIQESADKGWNEALFQLGCMYEDGRNVQKDIGIATELFNKCILRNDSYHSAHQGAVTHLAHIYYKKGDFDKAAELLLYGVNNPNMEATYLKAVMMYEGKGTNWYIRGEKDEAISLLSSIAKQGHKEAINYLKNIGY